MRKRKYRYFVGDFETTVYKGQQNTEVWASACVEFYSEDVNIFHSIREQYDYFKSLNSNIICYYHNLKFDGSFWLSFLMVELGFKQSYIKNGTEDYNVEWLKEKDMLNNSFKYSISDQGQWYTITIRVNNKFIEFRDSLKLLPFSVRRIGESFNTKHKKLEMEYSGFRYSGCVITDEEKEYIKNDVLVIKEALEFMYREGHRQLTIGSCCLEEYKKIIGEKEFNYLFPNVYDLELDSDEYGSISVGDWIRRSYRGGWCYLVKGKENKLYNNGTTADVNSLYPSMMSSESGNKYPIGTPVFWKGNFIPDEAIADDRYYFVRIKTRFYIKDGYLPFIQIKGNWLYKGTECLESSDVMNPKGEYSAYYEDKDGNMCESRVTMTMTMTDFELFLEHYNVKHFEILDGCYFKAYTGLFDEYINKYKKIKLESKGALRELAKLFLNNLYGKLSSSMDSSFKVAYLKEDKSVGYMRVRACDKTPGFIPVGSAITSYARNFTIRAAQKNYHGVNRKGFIYADTDSIHCDLDSSEIVGIKVDDKNFCCWKLECEWDVALFVRQKTYIEHVVSENLKSIDKPFYNIKCAGMPDKCKKLFELSMNNIEYVKQKIEDQKNKYSEDDIKFLLSKTRSITDFKIGLKVPGKLLPKTIRGGVLLTDTEYTMR